MLSNLFFGREGQPSPNRPGPSAREVNSALASEPLLHQHPLQLLAEEMETRLQDLSDVAQQCDLKQKELRATQRSLVHRLGEARALYAQLEASQEERRPDTGEDSCTLREEVAALRDDLNNARRENARMSAALAERDRVCQHAQRERDEMSTLLSQRSAELEAAQGFLPSTESIADTEVIQMVDALNYEIAQTATTLADSFEGVTRQLQRPPQQEHDSIVKSYERRFGRGVARLLLSAQVADPVLCLQFALQDRLTRLAGACTHQWCFANPDLGTALQRASDVLVESGALRTIRFTTFTTHAPLMSTQSHSILPFVGAHLHASTSGYLTTVV